MVHLQEVNGLRIKKKETETLSSRSHISPRDHSLVVHLFALLTSRFGSKRRSCLSACVFVLAFVDFRCRICMKNRSTETTDKNFLLGLATLSGSVCLKGSQPKCFNGETSQVLQLRSVLLNTVHNNR